MILPDLLDYNLDIVFCGMAASKKSKKVKAYYAGPGNKFWKILVVPTRSWPDSTGLTTFNPRWFKTYKKHQNFVFLIMKNIYKKQSKNIQTESI